MATQESIISQVVFGGRQHDSFQMDETDRDGGVAMAHDDFPNDIFEKDEAEMDKDDISEGSEGGDGRDGGDFEPEESESEEEEASQVNNTVHREECAHSTEPINKVRRILRTWLWSLAGLIRIHLLITWPN
ncbi:hypothetical protein HU200_021840 [Digitaria exilis]|uniref:Uncharacterized protein n=1 Tax=Digitaria exilis TaxID=1010633 RepID=A0A835EZ06_9POAL|nr:hypothetical protein HU200_021840 [Digitaria exilis]